MTRLRLQQLQPGMVIGNDAKSVNGELVLPKGTTLKPEHIQTLKAWGIPEIEIQDNQPAPGSAEDFSDVDPQVRARAEESIHRMFIKSNARLPATQELKRLALKQKLNP